MNVRDIIVQSANQYGIPVDYALSTAQRESGFNPRAQNPKSSAGGIFQFIDSTWEGYGQGDKYDPYANADAFGRFTRDNMNYLQKNGLETTGGTLYLAHFLGPQGAVTALTAPANAVVRELMPKVAAANPSVANMTMAELRNWAENKSGGDIKLAKLTEKEMGDNEKVSANLWNSAKQEGRDPEPQAMPTLISPDTFGVALENINDMGQQGMMSRKLLGLA